MARKRDRKKSHGVDPDGHDVESRATEVPEPSALDHPSLYLNRELSWLEFNQRVLAEAEDSRQPLLGLCLSDAVRDLRVEIFNRRPVQTQGLRRGGKRKSS